MSKKLYQQIASSFDAMRTCKKTGNTEWEDRHAERIEELVRNHLPSGGGFDSGTKFDFDKSKPDKLVFKTAFHHMNDNGFYTVWTEHVVTVRPSLALGFDLAISGRNHRDIKDYIGETFHALLSEEIDREAQRPA